MDSLWPELNWPVSETESTIKMNKPVKHSRLAGTAEQLPTSTTNASSALLTCLNKSQTVGFQPLYGLKRTSIAFNKTGYQESRRSHSWEEFFLMSGDIKRVHEISGRKGAYRTFGGGKET